MSELSVTIKIPVEIVKSLRNKDKNDEAIQKIYVAFLNHCATAHVESDQMEMFEIWAHEYADDFL